MGLGYDWAENSAGKGVGDDAKANQTGGVRGEACRIPAIAKSPEGYR
jgi:hypothetical protein